MKLNWKFQWGGRVQTKKETSLEWGRYYLDIFLVPQGTNELHVSK